MRISDWSSDVCSSDLSGQQRLQFDPNASYASSASRTPRQAQRWHNPPVPLPSTTMHPHNFLRCLLALCVLFALPASAQAPPTAPQPAATPVERLPLVVVHKSPTCGCRSEEQTSELQSLMRTSYAVFCLKKKTYTHPTYAPQN